MNRVEKGEKILAELLTPNYSTKLLFCIASKKDGNFERVSLPQWGNFKIFVLLRFYVKSILCILEVQKTAIFAILGQ